MKESEQGVGTGELCGKYSITDATFSTWKAKYREIAVSDAWRLKTPEDENRRRKKIVAGGLGFEPRHSDPESDVLPLDDPPEENQRWSRVPGKNMATLSSAG